MNLFQTGLSELHKNLENLSDPPTGISDRIDFEKFGPILSDLYKNDSEKGGRPNYDEILMVKTLFLQSIYSIVDEYMETEIYDSVRFINFLDYPERVPDQNTIWLFRERLSKTGKDKALSKEI